MTRLQAASRRDRVLRLSASVASACADGDARVIEQKAGFVVNKAALEVEGGSGVVVAPTGDPVIKTRVIVLEPLDGKIGSADVRALAS